MHSSWASSVPCTKNSVAKALSEMGRMKKTIFLVNYLSNEALRRRIQKGLNKGEAMHALARSIFFGKHGEFCEQALQDQLQRARPQHPDQCH